MTEDYEPISQDMQVRQCQYDDPLFTCFSHLGMVSECPEPTSDTRMPSPDGWHG
jgi:hypothetical protein